VARYGRLDRWAERDQQRFDQQRAESNVHEPGTEAGWQRGLIAFLSGVTWATKPALAFALIRLPIAVAHEQGILAAAVVTPVLASAAGLSIFVTIEHARSRRREGRNWFTGLAPQKGKANPSNDAVRPAEEEKRGLRP
jgi:hypothetical protein